MIRRSPILLSLVAVACGAIDRPHSIPVTVNVSVSDSGGAPVRALEFETIGISESCFATTGDDGACSYTCDLAADAQFVFASIRPSRSSLSTDREEALQEAAIASEQFAFRAVYRAPVLSDQTARIDVVAPLGGRAQGRVLNEDATPAVGLVSWVNGYQVSRCDPDGAFDLAGLPQTGRVWVYARRRLTDVMFIRLEDVGETAQLGDVSWTTWSDECELSVTALNWDDACVATRPILVGPTIVRDDLSFAIHGAINPATGSVEFGINRTDVIRVPAGLYYVVPGSPGLSDEVAWVLDAIESSDPLLGDLVQIDLQPGASGTVQIDYAASIADIWAAVGIP